MAGTCPTPLQCALLLETARVSLVLRTHWPGLWVRDTRRERAFVSVSAIGHGMPSSVGFQTPLVFQGFPWCHCMENLLSFTGFLQVLKTDVF